MTSGRGCIIYLMPADKLWLDAKLEKAQQHALDEKVPLAVAACILPDEYDEKLVMLQMVEMQLAKHNIPLITLIGTEQGTLPPLVKHSQPIHVYGHGGGLLGGGIELQDHPYKWPGIVINAKELKKIVDKKAYMC